MELLRGWALIEQRQVEPARRALESVAQSHIPGQLRPTYHCKWMMLHLLDNSLEQAEVSAEELERSLEGNQDGLYGLECRLNRCLLWLRRSQPEKALREGQALLELARAARAKFWEMKAQLLLASVALETGSANPLPALDAALSLTENNRYHSHWRADPWGLCLPLLAWAYSRQLRLPLTQELLLGHEEMVTPLLPFLRGNDAERRAHTLLLLREMALGNGIPSLELMSAGPDARLRRAALSLLRRHEKAPACLQICALGVLQIRADGQPQLTRANQMAVRILKYFLTFSQRPISADELLEAFWPESVPGSRSRHRLTAQISKLRGLLGSDRILVCCPSQGYQLIPGSDWSYDVSDFERLVAEARTHWQRGNTDLAEARYLRAEQLYRGDFLEDDRYEEFIQTRREELRARYEASLELLADRAVQRGRYQDALDRYRILVSGEMLRESVLEKLLRCLAALGDRAAAHQELESFCRRVQEHTGLPAEASTRSLLVALFAS
jgi:DNA-binding SARP family transcriptional activator